MGGSARRYHHGEVRLAALAAALKALESDGPDAVTMRAIAGDVGVDHRALYRHFPDRDALLAGVAAEGYTLLHKAFQAAGFGERALFDAFAVYVRFALARPHLHSLMLTRPREAMERDPALGAAVAAVLEHLMNAARGAIREDAGDETAKTLAFAGLSSAYGMITLAATQTLAPREPEALEAFLITQVHGVLEGRIACLRD